MSTKQQTILQLLHEYEAVVKKAMDLNLISTKNFVGDIIESMVCNVIRADKSKNSQKGYDAIRGKDTIQIKYRSINKSGKYRIRFKNTSKSDIGFSILAFCCKTEDGYLVYEIKVKDFIENTKFNKEKNLRLLVLDKSFFGSHKLKKHEIKIKTNLQLQS